ncbi:M35 family metallo-endopeptidase [Cupriavidus sp. 2KB_3]|uniref:M35 family metallo-endopeptidase n=1 Tax=Cupriavidus sp. 2KB_3 TaxID=3232980 RepID=UPI003F8D9BD0
MMRNDKRHMLDGASRTSTGGWLIATSDSTNMGKRLGLEGDHATCPACKVGGPVYNDCDPRWTDNGKSVLVEGARVYCQCKEKPRVFASQYTMSTEVVSGNVKGAAGFSEMPEAHDKLGRGQSGPDAASLAAYEADSTMICPNMTNAEFYVTVMRVRDLAVAYMDDRLAELARWNAADQDRVKIWFAEATPRIRSRLQGGLQRMRDITLGLTETNFERFSKENLAAVGCVPAAKDGEEPATASVCKPDKSFTIFIGTKFCYLSEVRRTNGVPLDVDSKLTVLVHELSHFPAAMDTNDLFSNIRAGRWMATRQNKFLIENADNIAAYVADIPNWHGSGDHKWTP